MAVFFDTTQAPRFRDPVITIGTFDGVHKGHTAILQQVAVHAQEVNGVSVLITFEPHPRKLLYPDQKLGILTPLAQKTALLRKAGIENIVVAPFTKEFAQLSAEDYIKDFLIKQFQPNCIVIGYDHRFGNDRRGNIDLLKQFAHECHYKVYEIPAQLIDEAAVSSTKIRHLLEHGEVADAAHMLGRNYTIKGSVQQGAKLGRIIGFPTANILPTDPDQLIPANGVYAVLVTWKDIAYKGMMNIGIRPTISNDLQQHLEVNIFDLDENLYGETLDIAFVAHLRQEQKFPSLDTLKAQLQKDKETAIEVFK
ncbi:MAG: bifunctional riboflavin kinase/FAD synthetase [Bacteroidota bacterium]